MSRMSAEELKLNVENILKQNNIDGVVNVFFIESNLEFLLRVDVGTTIHAFKNDSAESIIQGATEFFGSYDKYLIEKAKLHDCDHDLPSGLYGDAIYQCVETEDGELWAGNGEYCSQVNYCPYCGYKAKVQVELSK